MPVPARHPSRWLALFGMGTPEQRSWVLYDWANSAMVTVIITAVFPIYFTQYSASELPAEAATFRFSVATTLGLVMIALAAPILGAMADNAPIKKKLLGAFLLLGLGAVAAMFFLPPGAWAAAAFLFVLANVGANGSFVFYDSLLPHIAGREEMDRVSTAGYALGYVGGGLVLAACLLVTQNPGWFGIPTGAEVDPRTAALPARLSFLAVALWWGVFSLPLFRYVPEPRPRGLQRRPLRQAVIAGIRQLFETFRSLRQFRQALLMLVAFLIYNDGIGTIIRLAAIYGTELKIDRSVLIGTIVLVQFVGIPCAFGFGFLARWIGAKTAILLGLVVYMGISVLGYLMSQPSHFLLLGILVGMVQGGTQALSRSLFASMIPRHQSGEFFGLFAVFEKFAGIFGPGLFAVIVGLTGSSRHAILSVIAFFVVGGALLLRVNVSAGQAAATMAEREAGV